MDISELQNFSAKAAAGLAWAVLLMLFPQLPPVIVVSVTIFILGLLAYAFLGLSRAAHWREWAPQTTALVVLVAFVIWIGNQPGSTGWIGYLFGGLAAILCIPLVLQIVLALSPSKAQESTATRAGRVGEPAAAPERRTFVRFRPSNFALIDGSNIASITDAGTGDFTVNFTAPLNVETLVVHAMPPTPSSFRSMVSEGGGSVRVIFDGTEPEVVALRFDDQDISIEKRQLYNSTLRPAPQSDGARRATCLSRTAIGFIHTDTASFTLPNNGDTT